MKMNLAICVPTYNRPNVVEELLVRYEVILDRYLIDLHVFDSSEGVATKNIVEKCEKLNGHIFYNYMDSSVHSNLKVYKIYQNTELVKKYDYVWICSDAIRWSESVFKKVIENLDAKYDFIIPDYLDFDKIGDREYTVCTEIFGDLAWYMTLYGATIVSTEILKKINEKKWKYYESMYCESDSINFSHLLFYFDYMEKMNKLQVKHLSFSGGELESTKLRKRSGWHEETFKIWCKYWKTAINKLPSTYSNELKRKVIKKHGIYSEILSKENLISLRECGIYNLKVWAEFALSWTEFCDLSGLFLLGLAVIPPRCLVRKKNRNIEILKNRFEDFSKNHAHLYVYGAGQKGKLFAGVLKKMKIDIEGYIVTDGAEKNNMCNGIHIENYTQRVFDDKENGVIIGLNKKNEQDVIDNILTSENCSQILFGLSDYDRYCLKEYLER